MKIGVTNAVLSNTGDAAIYQAIIDTLVGSGLTGSGDVVVFDSNAAVTRKLYPDWRIHQQLTVARRRRPARLGVPAQKLRIWLGARLARRDPLILRLLRLPPFCWTQYARSYRQLDECDVVISSGGTYLVDHYNFAPRVVESEIVKSLRKPLVLWTQSLGPFKSDRALRDVRTLSETVDAVFFRDERSQEAWWRAVGPAIPGGVAADVVFGLERTRTPRTSVTVSDAPTARPRALISVREWSRGVDVEDADVGSYRKMMRAGGEELLARGKDVVALSTCQGVPSYTYDDSDVARRFFGDMEVEVDRAFHSPDQLLDEIANSEVVIATRMHLAILALVSRKPVIAVAYEFKTVELFRSLGLQDFVIRLEDADAEWMRGAVRRLLDEPERAMVSEAKLSELRRSAATPARYLFENPR